MQAFKAWDLKSGAGYRYDPRDHHGPLLYFLTQPLLVGKSGLADTDERLFRLLPALFGAAIALMPLLFRDVLGSSGCVAASLFLAVSPFLVYTSRSYIQESLLVFFSIAALGLWRRGKVRISLFLLSLAACSKETWPLVLPAFFLMRPKPVPSRSALAQGLVVFLLPVLLLYSSFFSHPSGLKDAFLSYGLAWTRLSGGVHQHGFFFYLRTLWISELPILVLGICAMVRGIFFRGPFFNLSPAAVPSFRTRGRHAAGLRISTLSISLFYTLIPYKTPWCFLLPWSFWCLLAGSAFRDPPPLPLPSTGSGPRAESRGMGEGRRERVGQRGRAILAASLSWLAFFSWDRNFLNPASAENPLAYASASPDLANLGRKLEALAPALPGGREAEIHVYGADYWPLPWLLRTFPHVGYWPAAEAPIQAPVLISRLEEEENLVTQLEAPYHLEYFALRQGIFLALRVREDCWRAYTSRLG